MYPHKEINRQHIFIFGYAIPENLNLSFAKSLYNTNILSAKKTLEIHSKVIQEYVF